MAEMPDLSGVPLRLTRHVYEYYQFQGYDTNDCGPTSVAIAANALLGRQVLEGPIVAEEMSHVAFEWKPLPHLVVPRIPNWATFPWGIAHYLRKQGFRARWRPFGTLERLERNLRADLLTMVIVGEPWKWTKDDPDQSRRGRWVYDGWAHVKILYGQLPGHRLYFVDPGWNAETRTDPLERFGIFSQEEDEFLREWRNLLRIFIEVGESPRA
jgi:hypothetical protein